MHANIKDNKSIKSEDPSMDWCRFIPTADEFLIAYLTIPPLALITLFMVGHAAELYLKAVLTKQTGDIDKAVKYNHNIKKLFIDCQKNDSSFFPKLDYDKIEKDEQYRQENHPELYLIGKYLSDLKYIGATKLEIRQFGFIHPNDYWISFFKGIRAYLKYPPQGQADYIQIHLQASILSSQARDFLSKVCS